MGIGAAFMLRVNRDGTAPLARLCAAFRDATSAAGLGVAVVMVEGWLLMSCGGVSLRNQMDNGCRQVGRRKPGRVGYAAVVLACILSHRILSLPFPGQMSHTIGLFGLESVLR